MARHDSQAAPTTRENTIRLLRKTQLTKDIAAIENYPILLRI